MESSFDYPVAEDILLLGNICSMLVTSSVLTDLQCPQVREVFSVRDRKVCD